MNKKILFFLLLPFLGISQVQIGQDIVGKATGDISGSSVSISAIGDIIAIGGSMNSGHKGHVRIFKNVNGTWSQVGQDILGKNFGDRSGESISISDNGNIIAIGSHYSKIMGNDKTGQVRVFNNIGGTWTQLGQDINGESAYDYFGSDVSLSSNGTILAVGAPTDNFGYTIGYVKVYSNISGVWIQLGQKISDPTFQTMGRRVSLSSDGSILAIAAPYNDTNGTDSGLVRIYKNISGTWTQIGQDIEGSAGSFSGYRIALSSTGNTVAIYEPNFGSNSSIVKVYENNSGNWIQIGQNINGESTGNFSYFGLSLSGDGTILAFGNPNKNQVKIYRNISKSWLQIGQSINSKNSTERSGSSLHLSENGENLIIGAPAANANAGLARVYSIKSLLTSNEFVQQNFNIYPNPTSDILNISLENNLVLEHVTIYNNLGQAVKTTTENVIDLSYLEKGLYFVEVTTNQGKATKKLVVK